jgi:ABC-type transporter Mla subunit MlaD
MEEALLFAVKIDQTDAIKQTTELTKSIQELTAVQKDLDASGQKNTEVYAENAAILRSLKKEQSDVNRFLDNSVKAFNAANGSINQQRANLSLLTQGYNNLSKEERENEQVGGKFVQFSLQKWDRHDAQARG